MVLVKTCGLNTADSVKTALGAGADYFGFIHYARSPRHVSVDDTRALVDILPRDAQTVQVLVDPDDALLDAVTGEGSPSFLQLHGKETPQRVAAVAQRLGKPIIKAVSVRTAADVAAAQAYLPHVHALLFDAKPPSDEGWLPGGNGLSFDWEILAQSWLKGQRWFLSGGLTAENVVKAIALTYAPGVDVSSGLESAPGVKDSEKITAFVAAAKSRGHGQSNGI
ncbi:MAG: phosphoribosylanthranilate isomerase [Pseudomonadota bacterium]